MKPTCSSSNFTLLFTFACSITSVFSQLSLPPLPLDTIVPASRENETFTLCLMQTKADVVLPSDILRYNTARLGKRTRVINTPIAVAYARSDDQVQKLVKCAVSAKVVVTPRSGGHSFESFSTTTGTLVIDISNMNKLVAARGNTAIVQAGIALGDLYLAIHKFNPELTFPAGTCPTVGLGGLVSSGGYGPVARKFGISAVYIQSATVVNHHGEIIQASENQHPDLFWALRGGGGGTFGLVLSYTLQLVRTPLISMFHITWTPLDTVEVLKRWLRWAPKTTEKLTMYLQHLPVFLRIYGHFLGTMEQLDEVLKESGLLDIGVPVLYTKSCSALGAKMFFNFDDSCQDHASFSTLVYKDITENEKSYARSLFFTQELPDHILAQFNQQLTIAPSITYVNIEAFGGIFATQSTSMTPYPHRQGILFQIEFGIYITGAPLVDEIAHTWSKNMFNLLWPYSNGGSYQGYVSLELQNPLQSYFGNNVKRLIDIKRKYDPMNVFQNPQSIQP
ncbi:hypothetical protein K7432_009517 [Basidiobolus ranarum]|uniref:FAD-binding PCMH-type domain-containing protein n=1 Tax=Basidiobolus ranarum TaxID=34480 RepID=A0ABR2VXC3_9FUNG